MAVQVRRRESPFITRLGEVLPEIRERFGVVMIGIFGSAVRGEERPDSDVDVLVKFAPGQATFRHFMELVFFLEDLFLVGWIWSPNRG
jgi:predicted nucleotidyltransferase